jgi:hypothetical protein
MIHTEQKEGVWYAYWTDTFDGTRLGYAVHALDRDHAIYLLGLSMGANPSKFARPIGEYFT